MKCVKKASIYIVCCVGVLFLQTSVAYAARFFVESFTQDYELGDSVTFSVYVDSEGAALNAFSGQVAIPVSHADIVSISTSSSITAFWIQQPSFSGGVVDFEGIVLNPGFNGSMGKVLDVTVVTTATGTVPVSFVTGEILANDGLATPIYSGSSGSSFGVSAPPPEDPPEEPPEEPPEDPEDPEEDPDEPDEPSYDPDDDEDEPPPPPSQDPEEDTLSTTSQTTSSSSGVLPEKEKTVSLPVVSKISSPTHPDQTVWYGDGKVVYVWQSTSTIDTAFAEITDGVYDAPQKKISVNKRELSKTLKTGVWYAHVQLENESGLSDVAHYTFRIDTTPPEEVNIWKVSSKETAGSFSSDFKIGAKDAHSGIGRIEVAVDDELPFTWAHEENDTLSLKHLVAGEHHISVEVFDKVGNSTRVAKDFSFTPFDPIGVGETIVENQIEEISVGPVIIPVKPEIISITSYAGFGLGVGQLFVVVGGAVSFADIWLLLMRIVSFIASFFRRRRGGEPWGVVYDSVTKQPLDPAYVVIKEKGEQKAMAITDLDGRYGFLIPPGTYTIEANKSHYAFPSKELAGRRKDELYDNLYFGEEFIIHDEKESIIRYNIPLDPTDFDWNEFAKKQQGLFMFHSKRKRVVAAISNGVFYVGFVLSVILLWNEVSALNIGVFAVYAGMLVFQAVWKVRRPATKVMDKLTQHVVPFAVIKAYLAEIDQQVKTVVADEKGQFYLLTPPGTYYFTVEVKEKDGTYSQRFKTEPIELKRGVVLKNLYVEK